MQRIQTKRETRYKRNIKRELKNDRIIGDDALWVWLDANNIYMPYDLPISRNIEWYYNSFQKARLNNEPYYPIFQINIGFHLVSVDLRFFKQYNNATNQYTEIKRIPMRLFCATSSTIAVWEWEDDYHRLIRYSPYDNKIIENAYLSHRENCQININGIPMILNFKKMTQINNGNSRKIIRNLNSSPVYQVMPIAQPNTYFTNQLFPSIVPAKTSQILDSAIK